MTHLIKALAIGSIIFPIGLSAQCLESSAKQKSGSPGTLSIKFDPDHIHRGEKANLRIRLANTSSAPISVVETSAAKEYELRVTDSLGKELPLTEYGKSVRGDAKWPSVDFRRFELVLRSGEAQDISLDISRMYIITRPDTYTVTACRLIIGLGSLVSDPTELTVR